jgi:hypothetical protein
MRRTKAIEWMCSVDGCVFQRFCIFRTIFEPSLEALWALDSPKVAAFCGLPRPER